VFDPGSYGSISLVGEIEVIKLREPAVTADLTRQITAAAKQLILRPPVALTGSGTAQACARRPHAVNLLLMRVRACL
jgi:hypothetical protein